MSSQPRYLALVLTAAWATSLSNSVLGQGQPVDTGSHLPVALWFIGTWILGLAIVYGIMRNRKRTRAERERTDQATKELYREEDSKKSSSLNDLS